MKTNLKGSLLLILGVITIVTLGLYSCHCTDMLCYGADDMGDMKFINFSEEILYLFSNRFNRFFARFKLYFKRKVSILRASFKTSAALSGLSVFNIISAILTSTNDVFTLHYLCQTFVVFFVTCQENILIIPPAPLNATPI